MQSARSSTGFWRHQMCLNAGPAASLAAGPECRLKDFVERRTATFVMKGGSTRMTTPARHQAHQAELVLFGWLQTWSPTNPIPACTEDMVSESTLGLFAQPIQRDSPPMPQGVLQCCGIMSQIMKIYEMPSSAAQCLFSGLSWHISQITSSPCSQQLIGHQVCCEYRLGALDRPLINCQQGVQGPCTGFLRVCKILGMV